MNRFFAQPHNGLAELSKDDAHHLTRVLRAREGDPVEVAWEGKSWQGVVETTDPCVIRIDHELASNEPPVDVILVQALAKADKMDWIVQKAVELGVATIYPVQTRYADVKLDDARAQKKVQHWQKVAEAAAKQSKRSRIPVVHPVGSLKDAATALAHTRRLVLYEKETAPLTFPEKRPTSLFIGPEGGFSEEEIHSLAGAGAEIASLGPRILRTETAGLCALSIVQYEIGDIA